MRDLIIGRSAAFSRALIDRLVFVVESLAVALLLMAIIGVAAARFDLTGAAYVWGFFWMRVAQTEDPVRLPVLALLSLVVMVATILVALVRWPKVSRSFEVFPAGRRAHRKMLERLG